MTLGIDEAANAEICHLHPHVRGQHDIGRLDILMDHPLVVGAGQGVQHLQHDADGVRNGHHGSGVERLAQARAMDEFHGDEGLPLVEREVIDRDDVGMGAAGGRLGFTPEAFDVIGAGGAAHQLGRDQLYGDRPADVGVVRLEDLAHAADADKILDDISADPGWELGRHGYPRTGALLMRPPAS